MHQFRYSALCSWRSWGHNDKLSSRAESDSTTLFSESNIPNQVAPTRSTPAPCYVQLRVKELELLHITHALLIFHKLMDTVLDLWYYVHHETTRKPGSVGEAPTEGSTAVEKRRDIPCRRSCLRCLVEFRRSLVPSLQAQRKQRSCLQANARASVSAVAATEEASRETSSARGSGGGLLHGLVDPTAYRRTDQERVRGEVHELSDLEAACVRLEMEYPEA